MRTFETLSDYALAAGTDIGVSAWLKVDQARIDLFADATGDHQWIHVDPRRTRDELGTSTIAHGYLTLSLIPQFVSQIFTVQSVVRAINYGCDKVRFVNMVPVDSRLRARLHLEKTVPGTDMLRAYSTVTVEIEGSDKPALVAETISLFYENGAG